MTKEQTNLLRWLAQEPGQYGECHGKTLDSLIEMGLAEIKSGAERQTGFIAKHPTNPMYRAVVITDVGREALREGINVT